MGAVLPVFRRKRRVGTTRPPQQVSPPPLLPHRTPAQENAVCRGSFGTSETVLATWSPAFRVMVLAATSGGGRHIEMSRGERAKDSPSRCNGPSKLGDGVTVSQDRASTDNEDEHRTRLHLLFKMRIVGATRLQDPGIQNRPIALARQTARKSAGQICSITGVGNEDLLLKVKPIDVTTGRPMLSLPKSQSGRFYHVPRVIRKAAVPQFAGLGRH